MGSQSLVYGTAIATTFGIQTIGFVAVYLLTTETFHDIVGGTNYILLAVLSAIFVMTGDGALPCVDDPRKILTTVLFLVPGDSYFSFWPGERMNERATPASTRYWERMVTHRNRLTSLFTGWYRESG